jgi:hypothetical protein
MERIMRAFAGEATGLLGRAPAPAVPERATVFLLEAVEPWADEAQGKVANQWQSSIILCT